MFKKVLMATTFLCFITGTAVADGFYVRGEAGVSVADIDAKGKKFDSESTGYVLGFGLGYDKDLNFGLVQSRGTDNVRVEGLLNFSQHDYTAAFFNGKVALNSDIDTFSFMPSVYYDAKSLHVYKNNDMTVYPYVGGGLGFAYHNVNDTEGSFKHYKVSVSNGDNVDFAWHVGAGLRADVNKNWSVSAGWRYVNLGEVETGSTMKVSKYKFKVKKSEADLDAHQFMASVTYKF